MRARLISSFSAPPCQAPLTDCFDAPRCFTTGVEGATSSDSLKRTTQRAAASGLPELDDEMQRTIARGNNGKGERHHPLDGEGGDPLEAARNCEADHPQVRLPSGQARYGDRDGLAAGRVAQRVLDGATVRRGRARHLSKEAPRLARAGMGRAIRP